jgi:hypothetical protein
LVSDLEQRFPLFGDLFKHFQVRFENFTGIKPICDVLPSLRELIIIANRIFEIVCAPTGFVVELQPLFEGCELMGFRVVRKDAGVNN